MRQAKHLLANQADQLERLVNERTAALLETVADLEAFSSASPRHAPRHCGHEVARILVEEALSST